MKIKLKCFAMSYKLSNIFDKYCLKWVCILNVHKLLAVSLKRFAVFCIFIYDIHKYFCY